MIVRRALARAFWAVSGFSFRSAPAPGSAVLVGAPHTSNWDFVFMLAIAWRLGISPRWLGKASLFRPPFGPLMRALGGIPVDRRNPGGLVAEVVRRVRAGEAVHVIVTPEGTRARGEHWKSGFYRIAQEAGLPVVLGYVDTVTRSAGLGPTLHLSGDVTADMDRVRAFYAAKRGINPEDLTPPRLRDES